MVSSTANPPSSDKHDNFTAFSGPTLAEPAFFIPNTGQFAPDVQFYAPTASGQQIWLTGDAIWFSFPNNGQETVPTAPRQRQALKLTFPNALPRPQLSGQSPLKTRLTYLHNVQTETARSNGSVWQSVRYQNLYPDIDLEISSRNGLFHWQFIKTSAQIPISRWTAFSSLSAPQSVLPRIRINIVGADQLQVTDHYIVAQSETLNFRLPLF
ncbi:MAG: hypothetical protein AAF629_06865, partial [Chloroflexota bacterium]